MSNEQIYSGIAPAHDAQGRPCWNIWASLPGQREVTVTTDSVAHLIAILTFLAQKGFNCLTDAITAEFEQAEQEAYDAGYNYDGPDDLEGLDDIDEFPEEFTAEDHAQAAAVKAHWARLEADKDYAKGVKDAQRDAADYDHERAWLSY